MSDDNKIREVIFDTETTGFAANGDDRIVEIALVEAVGHIPTDKVFHSLIDPQRDMPEAAERIHGHSAASLRGKPLFRDLAPKILEFLGGDQLVAHNAAFDIGFVNAELKRAGMPPLANRFVDTVSVAKRRFPGAKATLDDLCRRFGIDISMRGKHNALLDTQLLARVYLELLGGRDRTLDFSAARAAGGPAGPAARPFRAARFLGMATAAEMDRHMAFVGGIPGSVWAALADAESAG